MTDEDTLERFVVSMMMHGPDRAVGPFEAAAYRTLRDGEKRTDESLRRRLRDGEHYPSVTAFLGAMEAEYLASEIAQSYRTAPEAWPKERIEALPEAVRTEVRRLLSRQEVAS
jgi:hypothetical protein